MLRRSVKSGRHTVWVVRGYGKYTFCIRKVEPWCVSISGGCHRRLTDSNIPENGIQ
jgi:hypothetical protein